MSALKTLSSHERGVVWHQFTRVTKEGSYYRVKCNLCSDEEVFVQGRMKTMRYHLWTKQKDFYVENLCMNRSFTRQLQASLRYRQHLRKTILSKRNRKLKYRRRGPG